MSILICLVLAMTNPGQARDAKPRFKGVELYSWKDDDGGWVFVLMDGTNREKTAAQVKKVKTKYYRTKDLAHGLGRLAVGEQVFWVDRVAGFPIPPAAIVAEVKKAAQEAKLELSVPTRDADGK
ncbi:MAG: hypothetical protein U0840_00685 [Gemmataceae bacterium]